MPCLRRNLTCLLLFVIISSLLVLTNALEFTILHTNDVRSRIEETNTYGGRCTPTEASARLCYGGVARTATVVKQVRKERKNVVLLDAGDRLQGTEWYYHFQGKAQAEFMKILEYDAMTPGNYEFTKGSTGLGLFLDNIDFPVLGCNIDTTKEPILNGRIRANTMVLNNKVGIIGYTTTSVPNIVLNSGISNIDFKDAAPLLQNEVRKLQGKGVKIIIGLSHLGFFLDLKVAEEVEGIDVIVGGHGGTFLNTGPPPDREVAADDYPRVVQSPSGRSVLVVQAYKMSKYLGRLDVTFDDDGTLTEWGGKPILLDGNITPDPDVQNTVNTWAKDLHNFTLTQLGESYVSLDGERLSCRRRECNLGNLVTDAVLSCHLERPGSGEWSHVSMAMWNSGGIAASIPKGSITELDVITVLPYNNKVVLVKMKGKDIREMLRYSVHRHNDWDGGGRFLQLSGIRVVYDLHGSTDVSVHSVHVLCAQCDIPEYTELDDEEVYSFLTSQYLAEGGDGYDLSKAIIVTPDENSKTEADCVTKYIKSKSPIIQGLEERIRFVNTMDGEM